MTFKIDKLYVLEDTEDAIKEWADQANLHDHAGYHGLMEMSNTERGELIDKFKQAFSEAIHQEEPS